MNIKNELLEEVRGETAKAGAEIGGIAVLGGIIGSGIKKVGMGVGVGLGAVLGSVIYTVQKILENENNQSV